MKQKALLNILNAQEKKYSYIYTHLALTGQSRQVFFYVGSILVYNF